MKVLVDDDHSGTLRIILVPEDRFDSLKLFLIDDHSGSIRISIGAKDFSGFLKIFLLTLRYLRIFKTISLEVKDLF